MKIAETFKNQCFWIYWKKFKPLGQSFQKSEGIYDGLSKAYSSYVSGRSARGETQNHEQVFDCVTSDILWAKSSHMAKPKVKRQKSTFHTTRLMVSQVKFNIDGVEN